MNNTQCVIFDCEGTLVDSETLCCQALSIVFSQFGAHLTTEQAMNHFVGGKLADILEETRRRLNISVSIDTLEPLYRETLKELFDSQLEPMEGVFDVLKDLESKNITYCVASNGPRDKIEHALELTGLLPHFKGKIFSAFETNSWKPEPDLILYSAMNMGYSVDQCLYIDDTPKGIEAGVRAGMKSVRLSGVSEGTFPGTYQTIDKLSQLVEIV
ncbi:HAD-IA family hydrolase [Vibrio sp. LaRot3]|uniref:HAD-IA family hydrolase n=1 Tax=Vibrio sp. LaRot3 TaxID=2998829 RepID=UPI0022CDD031|nr:HAD-IA family hydrolase [Vibrio sp. LaRot3]MDA0148493.1 HAD-IA family hydrolase [Vibrio sp. LaRot3]